jgi:hypothetical protein
VQASLSGVHNSITLISLLTLPGWRLYPERGDWRSTGDTGERIHVRVRPANSRCGLHVARCSIGPLQPACFLLLLSGAAAAFRQSCPPSEPVIWSSSTQSTLLSGS